MGERTEYVVLEVTVNKFGNPERKEHWRKLEGTVQPVRISARAYRTALDNGTPYQVNAYALSSDGEDEDEE